MGGELTVVLSDFDDINRFFKDERLTGRPKNLRNIMTKFFALDKQDPAQSTSIPHGSGGGIVWAHGADWQEQRRFALRNLHNQGFSRSSMEGDILDEVQRFTNILGLAVEAASTSKKSLKTSEPPGGTRSKNIR